MSVIRNFYKFIRLPQKDTIPIATTYNGTIYSITDYFNTVYGNELNPINNLKNIDTVDSSLVKGFGGLNSVINIGAYFPTNDYFPFIGNNIEAVFGVEPNSVLDNLLSPIATYVDSTLFVGKYTMPSSNKHFLSYTFDDYMDESMPRISCVLDFKIGDESFNGFAFDFDKGSGVRTASQITLYKTDGTFVRFRDNVGLIQYANQTFEVSTTNRMEIPRFIKEWLEGYLEPYVDTNMTLKCYKCSSQFNRVNKTPYLTEIMDIVGVPRSEFILTHPVFKIELSSPPTFNYVYIGKLNRYYFVEDIIFIIHNLYEILLKVDVLMTYKEGLLKLDAFVDRNEFSYDDDIIDKKRVFEQGVNVEVNEIPNTIKWITNSDITNIENETCYTLSGYKIGVVGKTVGV